jgi:hypothetical protein
MTKFKGGYLINIYKTEGAAKNALARFLASGYIKSSENVKVVPFISNGFKFAIVGY